MNKKRIRRFIAFLCVAVTIACQMSFAFADTMNETDILLAGFSYSMDGSEIESECRYSMSATAYEYADRLELVNPVLLFGEQELPFPSRVTLEKQNESMFSTYIPWLNLSMIIETNHSEYYIDVFSEEVCIALGGHRSERIANYFEKRTVIDTVDDSVLSSVEPMYAANNLFTKTTGMLRLQAIWEPSKSNRIALRVNTMQGDAGEWVTRIRINDGYVPSSYVIASANPTGINTNKDFTQVLSYILNRVEYNIFIPSFNSVTSVSTTNGNKFSFDISTNVKLSDMRYKEGTSANGMLFYLFLDHNGVNPTPHGSLVVTTHVTAYGTMTYNLKF